MSTRAADFYQNLKTLWKEISPPDDQPARIAMAFLNALADDGSDSNLPEPFRNAVRVLHAEFDSALDTNRKDAFENLEKMLEKRAHGGEKESPLLFAETLWAAFFPEALYLDSDPCEQIRRLREKRVIHIDQLCQDPVQKPAKEILFTSNVLLTLPMKNAIDKADGSSQLSQTVQHAADAGNEKQRYWYDHPIPIGTPLENDEAVYGLAGLSRLLDFEKKRGNATAEARLTIILSVSVTHDGLREWALPWLREQMKRAGKHTLENLDVFAFTEDDAARIAALLEPWLNNQEEVDSLKKTFGVDGEYGRHYSFLKAFPALWSVLEDTQRKATFKIDLDQVFPQQELVNETGKSAFEHFRTPLWGALGKDTEGREVTLGMIAGALVNEKDIGKGLFTPDIPWPDDLPEGEDLLFYKLRPMAVSTRAELMTRYGESGSPDVLDGKSKALQRIHVTGGTNGIRFDSLRHHRPFTPSFIGRAEDQGYLLSVLSGQGTPPLLRYVHASGLIMRHDKEAFASAAVKAGKAGAYVGDLLRLFVFSSYAEFLPGESDHIKNQIDPFTGCFITPLPANLALLKLAMSLLDPGRSRRERELLLHLAGERLPVWIQRGKAKSVELKNLWISEKKAWDSYYNALDLLEKSLASKETASFGTAMQFKNIMDHCRII